jgi:hypothetical protein
MRHLWKWVVCVIALYSASAVQSATTTFPGFLPGFGSVTNAIADAVKRAKDVTVQIKMEKNDGSSVTLKTLTYTFSPFPTKEQLDSFVGQKINLTLQYALTHAQADKTCRFSYKASVERLSNGSFIEVLGQFDHFTFIKASDGTYQTPDFSGVATVLPPTIQVDVKANWVRLEYTKNYGDEETPNLVTSVLDTRWAESDDLNTISITNGYLVLATELVTGGTNGLTRFDKISLVTPKGTNYLFMLLGSMGTPIPEAEITLTYNIVPPDQGDSYVMVSGGEVGRRLQLYATGDTGHSWSPVGPLTPGGYPPSLYFFTPTGNQFFRVGSVEGLPLSGSAALKR